jgi:hypothetical protein
MGQLVDGKWSTENVLVQHDAKGLYFKRDSVSARASAAKPTPSFLPSPADTIFIAPSPAHGLIAPR